VLSTYYEVFLCYSDIWFLTYGIRAQGRYLVLNIWCEIHDEDTRNMKQEWRNSNFGLKTNHIPNIDMRNFDGKDPITWILQMEKFVDLHEVPHTQKVRIVALYLELNHVVWYRWICSRKSLITWTIFMEEMISHYEDTRRNTFFNQLINLREKVQLQSTLRNSKN
jgi:hypothetical protein